MSRGHTVKGVAGHDDVPREYADKSARDTDPAGSFEEINEWLLTLVDEHIARIEGEEARQKFLDAIKERLPKVFCDTAGRVVESLFESAPALLAECRALDACRAAEIEGELGRSTRHLPHAVGVLPRNRGSPERPAFQCQGIRTARNGSRPGWPSGPRLPRWRRGAGALAGRPRRRRPRAGRARCKRSRRSQPSWLSTVPLMVPIPIWRADTCNTRTWSVGWMQSSTRKSPQDSATSR